MLPVAKDCSAPLTTSINLLDGMCLSGEKDSLTVPPQKSTRIRDFSRFLI